MSLPACITRSAPLNCMSSTPAEVVTSAAASITIPPGATTLRSLASVLVDALNVTRYLIQEIYHNCLRNLSVKHDFSEVFIIIVSW